MGVKVLVIEDDPVLGPMLQTILGLEGFQATVVSDGTNAVQMLGTGSYRAAILDVMLPDKDGVSIMREIRTAEETAYLPVVMLTAKADSASTWAGWQAGCDLYMTKPFDPEQLAKEVHRLTSATGK